ncbi:enoyl-CoA hydratase-related protein [Gordonia sp. CPCC 205515]|uniref:enoyl-CoA hydratase-related protein n=1 Tax=Gordonia sp. CPCC 205515 TaxID=3140791 RepID=UPI003AF3C9D3
MTDTDISTAVSEVLSVTREDRVAIVQLNRPKARNALNATLLAELRAAMTDLARDTTVRAVVITGDRQAFCAGADISEFDRLRAAPLVGSDADREVWRELAAFAKPLIAAVEGLALGGGCELALACDTVIAGESARFGLPEVKLGVIPGAGGTQRLIRSVGKAKAMALLLTGDPWSAADAERAGLIARVVADGDAVAEAIAMAQRIAANGPLAVALAKDAALHALETSLAQGLQHEKRNFTVAVHSADCHEGQAAFLAKRVPEFTGK